MSTVLFIILVIVISCNNVCTCVPSVYFSNSFYILSPTFVFFSKLLISATNTISSFIHSNIIIYIKQEEEDSIRRHKVFFFILIPLAQQSNAKRNAKRCKVMP